MLQHSRVDDLVTQLENCFPGTVEVFSSSEISSSPTELGTYGNEKLAIMIEKYASGGDADFQIEDLRSKWESFSHSHSYRGESMQGILASESALATIHPCLSKVKH